MSTDDSGMKLPRYVQLRPWGSYRYKRRVPKRLLSVMGKDHVYQNLGTNYRDMLRKLPAVNEAVEALFSGIADAPTDDEKALAVVKAHYGEKVAYDLGTGQLDQNQWDGLLDLYDRLEDKIVPEVRERILSAKFPTQVLSLSSAFDLYAEYKDAADNKKLSNSLAKARGDLKAAIGGVKLNQLPLEDLTRGDALKYRDHLLDRVSPNSVTRYINIVRAVINHTINEHGMAIVNPFHNLRVKGAGNSAGDRLPLTAQEALAGFDGMGTAADLRAIYLTLWDTGARLAEITGLLVEDVNLQEGTIHIRGNSIRGLKTASSKRVIPLSDRAVEALQEHRQGKQDEDPIFARYGRVGGNTAASAAMMKHFRSVIPDRKKSLHSLRHKKKDDLRAVECPEEISKVLLGHSNTDVSARYGSGYTLEILRDWMDQSNQAGQT
ncbi:MAG: integrase [Rhodobacteraceae bacterium]|nr:MAG: integrase [Paracoccaceae bacterium]